MVAINAVGGCQGHFAGVDAINTVSKNLLLLMQRNVDGVDRSLIPFEANEEFVATDGVATNTSDDLFNSTQI